MVVAPPETETNDNLPIDVEAESDHMGTQQKQCGDLTDKQMFTKLEHFIWVQEPKTVVGHSTDTGV